MTALLIALIACVAFVLVMISKLKDDIEYLTAFKSEAQDLLAQYKKSFDILSEGFELLKKYNAIQDERIANLEKQVGSTTQDEVNQYLSDILNQVQLKVQDLESRLFRMTYEGPGDLASEVEYPIPEPVITVDSTNENVISDDAPKTKKKSRKKKVSE